MTATDSGRKYARGMKNALRERPRRRGSVQKPLIPDATLHLRKGATAAGTINHPPGEDFYDEITMIAAGNGRAQRTLPVIKQKIEMTMPMFKVGREEQ